MDSSGRRYEEKVEEVTDYMRHRSMPVALQQRVYDYFEHRYQRKMFDERVIVGELGMGYPLKQDVMMHNYAGFVKKVPFLANGSVDFISEIVLKLQLSIYFPGDVIIQAGKEGDAMFFLEHGRVEVQMPDGKVVTTLEDGMHFGEIALLLEERRMASIIALETCDIHILRKRDFDEVLAQYP